MICPHDDCGNNISEREAERGYCPKCKRVILKLDQEQVEVPALQLIDFTEYEPIFENTHSHLPAFDLINTELGLQGKEYYPVIKAWNYRIESLKQATIRLPIGKEWTDNRIHVLCVGGAGTGKGILKNALRLSCNSVECSGARTNLEQLIGKFDKKGNELPGYFKKKNLDVDEAHTLVTEEDKNLAGVMREFRIAMDTYGLNTVDKKNVDAKHFLTYTPETRFGFYIHDTILPPVFFDLGTARRLFAFELKPNQVEEDAAIKGLLEENFTNQLKEYINEQVFPSTLQGFSKEGIEELIFWIKIWNKFCLLNPNQRIRILGRRMFFSGKSYFMRLSTILGIVRNESLITRQTVKQACFDCVQFLLSTLQVYGNKSVLTLSRDIWKTSDQKEAMFLEWLHYQGALSEETSQTTISECQDKIGDIFGINERQSRSVYARLKKAGYVQDSKSRHDSRAWLGFNPNLNEFVSFKDQELPNLEDALLRVKWELEVESGESGMVHRHIPLREPNILSSSFSLCNNNEKPSAHCLSNHSTTDLVTEIITADTKEAKISEESLGKVCEGCHFAQGIEQFDYFGHEKWLCVDCLMRAKKYLAERDLDRNE